MDRKEGIIPRIPGYEKMKILEEGRKERIGRKGSQESDIFIHEGKDKRKEKFEKRG